MCLRICVCCALYVGVCMCLCVIDYSACRLNNDCIDRFALVEFVCVLKCLCVCLFVCLFVWGVLQ